MKTGCLWVCDRGVTGKVFPRLNQAQHHQGVWGIVGRAPSFLISALDGGDWWPSRSCRSTPDETAILYPLYKRLNKSHSWSGSYGEEKILWRVDPIARERSTNTFPWSWILGNQPVTSRQTRFRGYRFLETNPSLCDKQTRPLIRNEKCFLSVRPVVI
jgi:hypothetical protein